MSDAVSKRDVVVIGVDVGTQGVRVVAMDTSGRLLSSHQHQFPLADSGREQSPELWWRSLLPLLRALGSDLRDRASGSPPVALSVTSTSGTLIPLDGDHAPLHDALMYSDDRAMAEVERCRLASLASVDSGTAVVPFETSYGLPKMLWYVRSYPREAARIRSWCHAGDFVLGRLTGVWGVTDPTTALKTGFDPVSERWPDFISDHLGLPTVWLPQVVASGSLLGSLLPEVAAETGLPVSLLVTTGMTDGCASQVAAGAARPGEWSTTIGTTLVVKGTTRHRIEDPLGRIYNHRHPDGYWMPGGASNTGADWVTRHYAGQDLKALDAAARLLIPTPRLCYPLHRSGERFPFVSRRARGFGSAGLHGAEGYAARMEGVAYLERLSYELMERLSGETVARVSTAGGASQSDTWLEIRSNVLQKPITRMRHVDGAAGAAIVAASGTVFRGLGTATRAMTHLDRVVEPGALTAAYEERYRRFVEALVARGYLAETMATRR